MFFLWVEIFSTYFIYLFIFFLFLPFLSGLQAFGGLEEWVGGWREYVYIPDCNVKRQSI